MTPRRGGHGTVVISRQLSSRLTLALQTRVRGSRHRSSSLRCAAADDDSEGNVRTPNKLHPASRSGEHDEADASLVRSSVDELLDSPFFANNIEPYSRDTQESPKLLPFSTVPDLWRSLALCDETATLVAVEDPHHSPPSQYTYEELESHMADFSRGLASKGVLPSQRVALFAEASSRWLIADGGILMSGAADAVRGSKAPAEELAYIAAHANVTALVVDSATVLRDVLASMTEASRCKLRVVVVLWGDVDRDADRDAEPGAGAGTAPRAHAPCPVLSFEQVLELGAQLRPVSHKRAHLHNGGEIGGGDGLDGLDGGDGGGGGFVSVAKNTWPTHPVQPGDLASVVYTSGTTGTPKGVMLTHRNLISQVQRLGAVTKPKPGDRTLSLLPPWHAYERAASYFAYSCGVRQRYTNAASLKADLKEVKPDSLITVPLVLGTLYTRVLTGLAAAGRAKAVVATFLLAAGAAHVRALRVINGVDLRFALAPPDVFTALLARVVAAVTSPLHRLAEKLVYPKVREGIAVRGAVVSGGGSLPNHLDDFYESIGLQVSNGWGLTETSPVIAARRLDDGGAKNVRGSVGVPIPGTEVRVVDPETREVLPDGSKGLLLARGPGVMSGYLDDAAATARAIDEEGWLDTGDLGWVAPAGVEGSNMAGNVVLVGRVKDTIVLSNGENVEPTPLEDHVTQSPLVRQVMIVGSGERHLGAVVVPDVEGVEAFLGGGGGDGDEKQAKVMAEIVAADVAERLAKRPGARPEEIIAASRVAVLAPEQVWDLDSGCLTRTFKLRRDEIAKRHAKEIAGLFKRK